MTDSGKELDLPSIERWKEGFMQAARQHAAKKPNPLVRFLRRLFRA